MNNEELKKKIMEVIDNSVDDWAARDKRGRIHVHIDKLADVLIAAGIGDLKEHRIFAGKDGSIKQLYSGEEVEKIVKERKELKDELRSKVEYIHEQDEVIKEYKHRAEVAEREAIILSKWLANKTRKDYPYQAWLEAAQKQAEKELAEEGKDD